MPNNFKKDYKNQQFQPQSDSGWVSPRRLSVILVIFGLVIISLITYPLGQIFSGEGGWIVNQGVILFTLPTWELPGLGTLSIGEVTIRFYALLMLSGILAGYFLALFLAQRVKLSGSVIDKIFFGCIVSALLGARLVYVLFNLDLFQDNWLDVINLTRGGLSIFGALLGGMGYLFFYARQHKFNLFELLDILAPSVLLGQVIGRWGNFFNYEAYGPATGLFWKMYVPESARLANNYTYENLNAEFFHPTFLYEIGPNFLLLLLILWFFDNLTDKRSGLVVAVYAVGYGAIRFFTEFFRLDALAIDLPAWLQFSPFGGVVFDRLLVSQLLALSLLIFGIFVLVKRRNILFLTHSRKEVKV